MQLVNRMKRFSIVSFALFLVLLMPGSLSAKSINQTIAEFTQLIDKEPNNPQHYIDRGDKYFEQGDFFDAVEDYSTAIELDDGADDAYYGRGMAQGRQGLITEGINDLSIYIKRNPNNSVAYTKRGVRYIWKGDFESAETDLKKAISLDENNAEAHDDLGVVYARKGDYQTAIKHFSTTVQIDPSYQKGFHNLAMALYLTKLDIMALEMVNKSLALSSNHRDSMVLKSMILEQLGQHEEAAEIKAMAEFLPQGNWSESVSVE